MAEKRNPGAGQTATGAKGQLASTEPTPSKKLSGEQGRQRKLTLYHFTLRERLPSIREYGLIPHMDIQGITFGRPVVWLTKQPANFDIPTDAERVWLERVWLAPSAIKAVKREYRRRENCLKWCGDRVTRLTVNLSPHNRRLKHFAPWVQKLSAECDDKTREANYCLDLEPTPSMRAGWYVYLGTIPPQKIVAITEEGA